jgi:hypothetical protein
MRNQPPNAGPLRRVAAYIIGAEFPLDPDPPPRHILSFFNATPIPCLSSCLRLVLALHRCKQSKLQWVLDFSSNISRPFIHRLRTVDFSFNIFTCCFSDPKGDETANRSSPEFSLPGQQTHCLGAGQDHTTHLTAPTHLRSSPISPATHILTSSWVWLRFLAFGRRSAGP